jgi:hypothetical protein
MHLIRQQLIQLIKLNNNKEEVVTEDMQRDLRHLTCLKYEIGQSSKLSATIFRSQFVYGT